MPRRKRIPSLLDLSLSSIRALVRAEALRVAHVVVTRFVYDEIEAQSDAEREERDSQ